MILIFTTLAEARTLLGAEKTLIWRDSPIGNEELIKAAKDKDAPRPGTKNDASGDVSRRKTGNVPPDLLTTITETI